MSDELPSPNRRLLIVWYYDDENRVEVDASEFSWLELPELLRAALDYAEENLPHYGDIAEETETDQ